MASVLAWSNIGVWFLLLGCSYAFGNLTISSSATSVRLQAGSTTTLPCTVSGTGYNTFYNQIVWYKRLNTQDMIQINTGGIINKPFVPTGRYAVQPDILAADKVVMPLKLTGITVADNGTFVCQLVGNTGIIASTYNYVIVPDRIKDLSLTSNDTRLVDNGTRTVVSLEASKPSFIRCTCVGGNPLPVLRVYIGTTEITQIFNETVRETKIGDKGLQNVTYTVFRESLTFEAEIEQDGVTLRCVAEIPGESTWDKIATVKLEVEYPPMFLCDNERQILVNTTDYLLDCKIKAQPNVDLDSIFWVLGGDNSTANITVGQTKYGLVANASMNGIDTNTVDVYLAIPVVNLTSCREYCLHASNRLGERRHQIKFYEGNSTVNVTSNQMIPMQPKPVNRAQNLSNVTISLILDVAILLTAIVILRNPNQ